MVWRKPCGWNPGFSLHHSGCTRQPGFPQVPTAAKSSPLPAVLLPLPCQSTARPGLTTLPSIATCSQLCWRHDRGRIICTAFHLLMPAEKTSFMKHESLTSACLWTLHCTDFLVFVRSLRFQPTISPDKSSWEF